MRLGRLTIGSAAEGPSHQFKNLKNVTIDFDQSHWVTVIIGWNGSGKSNVLEALAIIFRDLIVEKMASAFSYRLSYRMGVGESERYIYIDADSQRVSQPLILYVASKLELDGSGLMGAWMDKVASSDVENTKISSEAGVVIEERFKLRHTEFFRMAEDFLPRYVFSYYSGESQRMRDVFRPYLSAYERKLRNGEDPGLKRLFFAMPVHSQFVLLAFLIQQSPTIRKFLEFNLGIDPDEGIESVLFVFHKPPWRSKEGDERFWYARGLVRDFLARLYEISLAPIRLKRKVTLTPWDKPKDREFLYLFVKDVATLRRLVAKKSPAEFFRDLESTHVSELIEEVRIRVKLKKNDGTVTFRELSEGEQQLLTVLGLLRFTAKEESLFLLDEPDTHLNPRWCVDYLNYLEQFVDPSEGSQESSHVVLTTHNPLAIAELEKQQVQILQLRAEDVGARIVAFHPEYDPRGQGYAAIVTSDMFGIASSLDRPTQLLLEQQRLYAGKPTLTQEELLALDDINAKLERLGFRFFLPDDEYSRYLRKRFERLKSIAGGDSLDHMVAIPMKMSRQEREDLADELIDELLKDEVRSK